VSPTSWIRLTWLPIAATIAVPPTGHSADWLQFGYDAAHSGNNTAETVISANNVAGLRQRYQVELPTSSVDSAPVYLSGVVTASGTKNLLFVLGEDGTLIAIDADVGSIVWSHQVSGVIPTQSTPAIGPDRAYVYAYGLDGYVHKWHVDTGEEVTDASWPELITLKPDVERVAGGLTIATSGTTTYLYVVTNSNFDGGDYQGHLTTIDLGSGAQSVFNTLCSDNPTHLDHAGNNCPWPSQDSPGGNGMWGRGGATFDADTAHVYVTSGNGWFDANTGGHNWGDSVLSLMPNGAGTLGLPEDSYTPTDYLDLSGQDLDLGAISLAILPVPPGHTVTHLGAQVGKDAMIRLIDLDNMNGSHRPGGVGGELQQNGGGGLFTQPAVWIDAEGNTWMFVTNADVEAFKLQFDVDGVPDLLLQGILAESSSSPVVAGGLLYVVGQPCTPPATTCMLTVEPTTGNILWASSQEIDVSHWASPILVDGALYIVDGAGLHRFDLSMRIVTPNAGEGGTISPGDPQTVESGQTVTFEVDSEAGYQVATVTGCGVYSNNGRFWTTAPILDDCTVLATFVSESDRIFRDGFDGY
jgi:putative pyrroloquinoline-quinone binding quinoprotein